MSGRAVAVYDLSGRSGYAIYSPEMDEPRFGTAKLPPTRTNGSVGPALKHLFDHITWVQRNWPLAAIGYEAFLAPTGGKKDDDTTFVTSPAAIKKLTSLVGVTEMCAEFMDIESHSIHNASWRRYWLGSQPRGTKRETWKKLSITKAKGLGWDVKNDDEADALGQLHFLLHKLEIRPRYGRNPSQELIQLGYQSGVPVHV